MPWTLRLKTLLRTAYYSIVGVRNHPYYRARADIYRAADGRVLQGPFSGQRLPMSVPGLVAPATAVGCYERELHDLIEEVVVSGYETFVDVGASHGYYAVGLAVRCPDLNVVAFEADPVAREELGAAAQMNGVADRIDVRGHCSCEDLEAALSTMGRTLVLMDVEGGEEVLADPVAVPRLRAADILIEDHEIPESLPGLRDRLCGRFRETHAIRVIPLREFSASDVPLPIANRFHVMNLNLRTPGQHFLWMQAKAGDAAAS